MRLVTAGLAVPPAVAGQWLAGDWGRPGGSFQRGGSSLRGGSSPRIGDARGKPGRTERGPPRVSDAIHKLPAVAELELLEATARARPGTPDNAPLLGRVPARGPAGGQEAGGDVPGLIIATGFFRHGVLLTPAAAAVCRQLMDGFTDPRWAAFRPARFSPGLPDPLGEAAGLAPVPG